MVAQAQERPTVLVIVEKWLRKVGYDGLYSHQCACLVGDLAPCGEIGGGCVAGHKIEGCDDACGLGCDCHVGERIKGASSATYRTMPLYD